MVSAGCMHLEQLSKHRWIFVFTFDLFRLQQFILSLAGTMSHHFRGVQHYADKLMDYADGRAVFRGRGQRPSNKDVLKQMSAIDKCRQRSYFKPATERERDCSCGWHTKAAARRKSPTAAAAGPSFNFLFPPFPYIKINRVLCLCLCFQDTDKGKRRCPVCHQLKAATAITPEGKCHRVLGRSNRVWCPYGDDQDILDKFLLEQRQREKDRWA